MRRHPATNAFARFALVQGLGGSTGSPTSDPYGGDYLYTDQDELLETEDKDLLIVDKAPSQ